MDAAKRGETAAEKQDYETAIREYTIAIGQNPKAVSYYIERSAAYMRLKPSDPTSALLDSERALVLARERGKRELIGKSQLRRGLALYSLGQYGDTKQCLKWAKEFLPKDNTIRIWEVKVDTELAKLGKWDEKAAVMVKEVPDLSVNDAIKGATVKRNSAGDAKPSSAAESTITDATTASAATEPQVPAPGFVQTPPSKIRHEWYQNPNTITLSLMVKGVPKDKTQIDIQSSSVAISFPLPSGADYDFSLDPLFALIDPSQSSYKILSTKIELSLKKAEPGRKWHNLEGTEPLAADASAASGSQDDAVRQAVLQPALQASAPAYPTSSKSGPKNWDKLADSLTAKKPSKSKTSKDDDGKTGSTSTNAGSGGDEVEGEEEEQYLSDDEGDPVNGFFKKLYKNADPDTRRAMMKSYTESNGTALSTNWSEVGKKKVETSPPDGMIAKNWDE